MGLRPHIRAIPVLLGGALLAGYAAARYGAAQSVRRERIAAGELRELDAMWAWVDDTCWHARFSTPPGRRDRRAVVLVHGFGASSRYLVPLAERLARWSDVFVPDLPGHGKTGPGEVPLDIAGFAEALAEWFDAMRLSGVRMIGHSMGCQIAVELARRRPDLVERLVLLAPTVDRNARTLAAMLPRFVAGGLREPPGIGLLLLKDYIRARRSLPVELRTMFDYRIENAVRRLGDMPLLLVRGEHDLVAPAAWLRQIAANAHDARVAIVRGAAHAVHFSDPDAVVRIIRPFLAETTARIPEPAHSAS